MDEKKRKETKPKTSTATWVVAAILIVMLLVTSVLGATAVGKQITDEGTTISLTPEQSEKTNYFYKPASSKPESETSDGATEWSSETGVNLFSDSYIGADGTETVHSENGDKVVAPGTSNTYRFSLKNTGNVSLDYVIGIKGLFGATSNLPIKVRLATDGKWIVGGEDEYVSPADVDEGLTYASTIAAKKSAEYVLEWIWEYESGNDSSDTESGTTAAEADPSDYNMTITTVAQVTAGAAPEDENGNFLYELVLDPALFATIVACGALVVALCAIVFVNSARKRKAAKAENAQPENAPEQTEGQAENRAEETDDETENRADGNEGNAE